MIFSHSVNADGVVGLLRGGVDTLTPHTIIEVV